jgi:hypothetical protein
LPRPSALTEKQRWSYLWRHIMKRSTLDEDQAKLAALLAMQWLEKREKK